MSVSSRNLYILLTAGLVLGYLWLFFAFENAENEHAGVCLFRYVTGIPCPSCGSTRSVISLLQGHIMQAFSANPMGIIVAGIMIVTPFWISFDFFTGKTTLHKMYCRSEEVLRRPVVAAPLIAAVIINWIWNITKGI